MSSANLSVKSSVRQVSCQVNCQVNWSQESSQFKSKVKCVKAIVKSIQVSSQLKSGVKSVSSVNCHFKKCQVSSQEVSSMLRIWKSKENWICKRKRVQLREIEILQASIFLDLWIILHTYILTYRPGYSRGAFAQKNILT